MPFGAGPAKALDCFLEIANSMGLTVENFDNYAGHADYGEQDEILGILGHVDVVPCSGNWICDPFKPEIIDGKLYGRGVLDDKGPLLACLHAVKILKAMGLPLQKRIRFILAPMKKPTGNAWIIISIKRKSLLQQDVFYTGCCISTYLCREGCLPISTCNRYHGRACSIRRKRF